ncbi:hypothetical protein OE88DRAFT_1646107 [Heliocybe sulcata]|uniref:Uncharacterized protein n=1 Tax=Heliocybe sulcata TaxID=5364 RepID=A0A5C3MXC0_9AGAM|nr:hypothetical protein OE88DRAFT_1646107 [Heliocybe sulcata]
MSGAPNDQDYPEQHHAGAVGYGPEYHKGATFGDKMSGLTEEAKGKITRKPEVVEHGHEMRTGALKQKQQEVDDGSSPFGSAGEGASAGPAGASAGTEGGREQAATVAPAGTQAAEDQRTGNDEKQKMMTQ